MGKQKGGEQVMSNWQTPKTNWGQPGQTVPGVDDFNRIEGNTQYLKDEIDSRLPKTGGTMTGILTAQSNTSYTVRQVRNIILSTASADVNAMQNGDIWIKYRD